MVLCEMKIKSKCHSKQNFIANDMIPMVHFHSQQQIFSLKRTKSLPACLCVKQDKENEKKRSTSSLFRSWLWEENLETIGEPPLPLRSNLCALQHTTQESFLFSLY